MLKNSIRHTPIIKFLFFLALFSVVLVELNLGILSVSAFNGAITEANDDTNSVLESNYKTLTSLSDTNKADAISITTTKNDTDSSLKIKYKVLQTFAKPSHGVFLALPKNQDGVWTEYKIQNISRSDLILDQSFTNPSLKLEKYESFIEWNQFRVRIGDKDQLLARGQYLYQFEIEATLDPKTQYDFTLLSDWLDPVDKISLNQEQLCQTQVQCLENTTFLKLNPNAPKSSEFMKFWNSFGCYSIIIVGGAVLIYLVWYRFGHDIYKIQKATSPEFEPPKNITPWQAAFLAKDGNLTVKNTLLSYILWLSHKKYLKIVPDGDPNDKKTVMKLELIKTLPEKYLPKIFNQAIELSIGADLNSGILASKINQSQDGTSLYKQISSELVENYKHLPISQSNQIGIIISSGFLIGLASIILFQTLQDSVLLGNSYQGIFVIVAIVVWFGVIVVCIFWSQPTLKGAQLINQTKGYEYYLKYVEKYKLDFTNNPDEGVQYYLEAVPYAAAFGVLDRFQKYFDSILPNSSEITQNAYIYSSFSQVVFYSPSSDSSDGGGFSDGGGSSGGGGSW